MIYKKRKSFRCFIWGTRHFDFFPLPAIRFGLFCEGAGHLTIEWLKWYIGVKWFKNEVSD